jgi:hypothetical protein
MAAFALPKLLLCLFCVRTSLDRGLPRFAAHNPNIDSIHRRLRFDNFQLYGSSDHAPIFYFCESNRVQPGRFWRDYPGPDPTFDQLADGGPGNPTPRPSLGLRVEGFVCRWRAG